MNETEAEPKPVSIFDRIIKDVDYLRQPSLPVTNDIHVVSQLQKAFDEITPYRAKGLAACQIGILERAFIAHLNNETYIFVNPTIELKGCSVNINEGCLSLPGITRRISRFSEVTINAETIYSGQNTIPGPLNFKDYDAAAVQHEMDHLNGILIIDIESKAQQKLEDRAKRIQTKRDARSAKNKKVHIKMSPKRASAAKKMMKQQMKWEKTQTVIKERYRLETEGYD